MFPLAVTLILTETMLTTWTVESIATTVLIRKTRTRRIQTMMVSEMSATTVRKYSTKTKLILTTMVLVTFVTMILMAMDLTTVKMNVPG